MPSKIVFIDGNDNELDCYLNDKGLVYISVGQRENEMYNGYITLEKQDVRELIAILSDLEKNMS